MIEMRFMRYYYMILYEEREGGREGGREGEREGGREGRREGGKEGERKGQREREGGREGRRREGGGEREREREREKERERDIICMPSPDNVYHCYNMYCIMSFYLFNDKVIHLFGFLVCYCHDLNVNVKFSAR